MEPCCNICKQYNSRRGICKLDGSEVSSDHYCDWFEGVNDFIEDDVFSEYMDFFESEY